MISYKAEEAGCKVVFVDPKNTTKTCSDCGTLVGKELCERTHNCPQCGLSIDRDLNAAKNILKIATAGQAGSNACGDGTIVPSLKQEVHIL
ncbi:MAG: transposase [Candidatus Aenigmarchaeota archaeon]|nr:transposase [Candidatus Aenigmarchaeota archaeon]